MRNVLRALAFVAALILTQWAWGQEVELLGAGATFPFPLYSKMFQVYNKEKGVKVNYQAIGSGGGIRQLSEKTVDFGGTDAPMRDEEMKKTGAEVLHIPICLGAIAVAYNLPGNPKLKFTPDVLADIFLGEIKKWNDPRIVKANSSVNLPDMSITVVHRSDGSGTTFAFSDYLSKVSKEWEQKVGKGTALNWPVGLGGKGNPGVAGLVKQTPGSIGYVELIYAIENKMPVASIKNKTGKFTEPSLKSVSVAANVTLPDHTRVSITDTSAADGYPISSFTWIMVYKEQNYGGRSKEKAKALVDLLWWMVHGGQKYTTELLYASLPKTAVSKAEKLVKSISYDGKPLM